MTNSRRRKDIKEYNRGLAAGDEGREQQSLEQRPSFGPYADGFRLGAEDRADRLLIRKRLAAMDAKFNAGQATVIERNTEYGRIGSLA